MPATSHLFNTIIALVLIVLVALTASGWFS